MKKLLKVLAGAAALAAIVPFKCKADENGGTVQGLLYKVDWSVDPDYQSEPEVNVTFGFNNPFEKNKEESHIFADEIVVDYCCDETLAHVPVGNTKLYTEEDVAEMEKKECSCGEDCSCSENKTDAE